MRRWAGSPSNPPSWAFGAQHLPRVNPPAHLMVGPAEPSACSRGSTGYATARGAELGLGAVSVRAPRPVLAPDDDGCGGYRATHWSGLVGSFQGAHNLAPPRVPRVGRPSGPARGGRPSSAARLQAAPRRGRSLLAGPTLRVRLSSLTQRALPLSHRPVRGAGLPPRRGHGRQAAREPLREPFMPLSVREGCMRWRSVPGATSSAARCSRQRRGPAAII